MLTFLVWCLLFAICWPLALIALVLAPLLWLVTLPFRLIGFGCFAAFALVAALFLLPARVIAGRRW